MEGEMQAGELLGRRNKYGEEDKYLGVNLNEFGFGNEASMRRCRERQIIEERVRLTFRRSCICVRFLIWKP